MGSVAKHLAEAGPAVLRMPASIDVAAIRKGLGLSQPQFGARFGFTVATIRSWEQGRTRPDASNRAFLITIKAAPDVVTDAIAAARIDLESAKSAG